METYVSHRAALDAAFRRAFREGQSMRVEKFVGLWWVTPALAEACS